MPLRNACKRGELHRFELDELGVEVGGARLDHVGGIRKNDNGNVGAAADGLGAVGAFDLNFEVNVVVVDSQGVKQCLGAAAIAAPLRTKQGDAVKRFCGLGCGRIGHISMLKLDAAHKLNAARYAGSVPHCERQTPMSKASISAMMARRRRKDFTPFDDDAIPKREAASLAEQVEEGVMLAEFGARMALKNQIIIGVLTDADGFNDEHVRSLARAALYEEVQQEDESASIAEEERDGAELRKGKAQHHHDYRVDDVANLRRREKVHAAVAEKLWRLREDTAYLDSFVARARADAWSEIAGVIENTLDRAWPEIVVEDKADGSPEKRLKQLRKELRREVRAVKRGW